MNFIKVTSMNGEEIRINVNLIESYGVVSKNSYYIEHEYIGYTYIFCNGMSESDLPYIVKETPNDIDYLIKEL